MGDTPSAVPSPHQEPQKPWRTEGLPPRQPEKPRLRRSTIAVWLVGYLLLFGVLTVQDRRAGPQPVPYTEFKNQVNTKNVGALFARGNSIQGELKKAAALPEKPGETYQRFSTERPTFATDDLLAELTDGGSTVRATPLVEQRGRRLLRDNRGKLDAIVAQLLERESLDEPEIYAAAGIARPVGRPSPTPVPA
jgi:cell division protease FtsH